MVENVHYDSRLYAHLPGMVAKGLAQAMAADGCLKMQRPPGRAQNAVGLAAAQRLFLTAPREYKHFFRYHWKAVFIEFQGFTHACVQGNLPLLSRFAFPDGNMFPEAAFSKMIDVAPPKGQQVADPHGGINPHTYDGIITQIALLIKEIISSPNF